MTTEQIKLLISELIYQKKVSSQADFSRKLGYKGRSYVSDMVNGKKPANIDNDVLQAFPSVVNPDWLQTGKGCVLLGESTKLNQPDPKEKGNTVPMSEHVAMLVANNDALRQAVHNQVRVSDATVLLANETRESLNAANAAREVLFGKLEALSSNYATKDDVLQIRDRLDKIQKSAFLAGNPPVQPQRGTAQSAGKSGQPKPAPVKERGK